MENTVQIPFRFSQIRDRDTVTLDLNPPDSYRNRYRNAVKEIVNLCSAGGTICLNRPVSYENPCIYLTIMGHHWGRDVTTSFLILKYSVYLVAYTLGGELLGQWMVCKKSEIKFADRNVNYAYCDFDIAYKGDGLEEYENCLGRSVLLSALYILHTGDGDKQQAFEAICHNIAEPVRILRFFNNASAGMDEKGYASPGDWFFNLVNIWELSSNCARFMYDNGKLPESVKSRLNSYGIKEETLRFVFGLFMRETKHSSKKRLAEGKKKNREKFKNITKEYKGNIRLKKRTGRGTALERERIFDRWLRSKKGSPDVWRCLYRILVEPDDRIAQYIATNSNIIITKPDGSVIYSYAGDSYEVAKDEMNMLRSFD